MSDPLDDAGFAELMGRMGAPKWEAVVYPVGGRPIQVERVGNTVIVSDLSDVDDPASVEIRLADGANLLALTRRILSRALTFERLMDLEGCRDDEKVPGLR